MKFNWGHGIVLAIIIFVLGMGLMVFITYQNTINLVHEDYYPRELEHQTMIDKRDNALKLEKNVAIFYKDEIIEVSFPEVFDFPKLKGEIQLFRPSSGVQDVYMLIKTDGHGKQRIIANALEKGKYIVKVEWEYEGTFYFAEKEVYIQR